MITLWCKFVTWFWYRSRLFYLWTSLYRLMNERKWKDKLLPVVTELEDVEDLMKVIKWESDKSRWLDSISLPQATYGRHELGRGSDCDDSAFLAATLIERIRKLDPTIGIKEVGLLSVLWRGGGHAVCIFKLDGNVFMHNPEIGSMRAYQWVHIGNWNLGKMKKGFASVEAIVFDILSGAGVRKENCIGWSLLDSNLKHVKYSSKVNL